MGSLSNLRRSSRLGHSGARWTGGSRLRGDLFLSQCVQVSLSLSMSPCLFSLLLFLHLSPTAKTYHVPPRTPGSLSKSQALPVVHRPPLPPSIPTPIPLCPHLLLPPFLPLIVLLTGLLSPTSGPLHLPFPLPGDVPIPTPLPPGSFVTSFLSLLKCHLSGSFPCLPSLFIKITTHPCPALFCLIYVFI